MKKPDEPSCPKRDLEAAKLEAHIRKVVDQAPPLTPTQRTDLAAILRPVRENLAEQCATREESP